MKNMVYAGVGFWLMIFLALADQTSAGQIGYRPNSGIVKYLQDALGNDTGLYLPITGDQTAGAGSIEEQGLESRKAKNNLRWLKEEKDPYLRRQYLADLQTASGQTARQVVAELLPLLERETEASVRVAYLACFSSLATKAGLEDSDVLEILALIRRKMTADTSWNVRVYAATLLSWYGEKDAAVVIHEAITKQIPLTARVQQGIPAALQRIGSHQAIAGLETIRASTQNDRIRPDAAWRLYRMGFGSVDEVIDCAVSVAAGTTDPVASAHAVAILTEVIKIVPEKKGAIINLLAALRDGQTLSSHTRFLDEAIQTVTTTSSERPLPIVELRAGHYNYFVLTGALPLRVSKLQPPVSWMAVETLANDDTTPRIVHITGNPNSLPNGLYFSAVRVDFAGKSGDDYVLIPVVMNVGRELMGTIDPDFNLAAKIPAGCIRLQPDDPDVKVNYHMTPGNHYVFEFERGGPN
jgi:hypothetical protein